MQISMIVKELPKDVALFSSLTIKVEGRICSAGVDDDWIDIQQNKAELLDNFLYDCDEFEIERFNELCDALGYQKCKRGQNNV